MPSLRVFIHKQCSIIYLWIPITYVYAKHLLNDELLGPSCLKKQNPISSRWSSLYYLHPQVPTQQDVLSTQYGLHLLPPHYFANGVLGLECLLFYFPYWNSTKTQGPIQMLPPLGSPFDLGKINYFHFGILRISMLIFNTTWINVVVLFLSPSLHDEFPSTGISLFSLPPMYLTHGGDSKNRNWPKWEIHSLLK